MLSKARLLTLVLVVCLLPQASAALAQQTPPPRVAPVDFGTKFPAVTLDNLNLEAGPNRIDLGQSLGSKPLLLYYWIPGHPIADEMLIQVQEIVAAINERPLAMYAVVFPQPGRGPDEIKKQITALGVKVPVLSDPEFRVGQQLRVQSVPNVTMIDREGVLRLTNGASLLQVLEYNMNLEQAIQRLARTGKVGSHGYLPRYFPATELIGKKCPEFKAPLLGEKDLRTWSSLADDRKLNVLVFWSVDCPHCRRSLPELNAWLKQNGRNLNVVSLARVTSEANEIKTREFCDTNEFSFKTIADHDNLLSDLFRVTTTPTVVIIKPDGTIDSVITSGGTSLERVLEQKASELLPATTGA